MSDEKYVSKYNKTKASASNTQQHSADPYVDAAARAADGLGRGVEGISNAVAAKYEENAARLRKEAAEAEAKAKIESERMKTEQLREELKHKDKHEDADRAQRAIEAANTFTVDMRGLDLKETLINRQEDRADAALNLAASHLGILTQQSPESAATVILALIGPTSRQTPMIESGNQSQGYWPQSGRNNQLQGGRSQAQIMGAQGGPGMHSPRSSTARQQQRFENANEMQSAPGANSNK